MPRLLFPFGLGRVTVWSAMPPKKPVRPRQSVGSSAITPSAPAQRLRAALAQRKVLMEKVARRRATLELVQRESQEATQRVAAHVEPLFEQAERLDENIHELFERIIEARRREARVRATVVRVRALLMATGALSPRVAARGGRSRAASPPQPSAAWDDDADLGPTASEPWGPGAEAASAQRPAATVHGQLRALYRRLVDAFHPDRVLDPVEKAACTEVMKDITEAYRRGDLARLLEIEHHWMAGGGECELARPDASDAELESQAVAVERGNDELRAQLAELDKTLRAARRTIDARLARALKQGEQTGLGVAELHEVRELELRVRQLHEVERFVARFLAKEISLEEFARGPELGPDEEEDDDDFEDAFAMLTELAESALRDEQRARGQAARGRAKPDPRRPRR